MSKSSASPEEGIKEVPLAIKHTRSMAYEENVMEHLILSILIFGLNPGKAWPAQEKKCGGRRLNFR